VVPRTRASRRAVDDPYPLAAEASLIVGALFGQDRIVRKLRTEQIHDQLVRTQVAGSLQLIGGSTPAAQVEQQVAGQARDLSATSLSVPSIMSGPLMNSHSIN